MSNNSLKEYWAGYRAAKRDNEECGFSYVVRQYSYGLNGKTRAWEKGYFDFMQKTKKKLEA